jgi:putative membrane protein
MQNSSFPKLILILEILALVFTGLFNKAGWDIWALEVFPAVFGTIFLVLTYRKFQFSNLVYTLLFLHSLVLMYGGMYTYAETPLGFWVGDIFGWTRNNYDKLGHFLQGFTPVLVLREYFVRRAIVNSKKWLSWILVLMILGTAAFYEFIEWWIALTSDEVGDAFLGSQGSIWDTQSDMLMCMIGSIIALVLLSKWQDRQINKIQ